MNGDHADALDRCAARLLGRRAGMARDRLILTARSRPDPVRPSRFRRTGRRFGGVRARLVALADAARNKAQASRGA
jgi:hypothetical protein